ATGDLHCGVRRPGLAQHPNPYQRAFADRPVADVADNRREKFIVRTYNHLFGAILLFAAIEAVLFTTGIADVMAQAMLGTSWLVVLCGFMVVSWLASHVAMRSDSLAKQYAALVGFVAAEAIIFVPLLWIANAYAPGAIQSAGLVTIAGFAGLTGIAFVTK